MAAASAATGAAVCAVEDSARKVILDKNDLSSDVRAKLAQDVVELVKTETLPSSDKGGVEGIVAAVLVRTLKFITDHRQGEAITRITTKAIEFALDTIVMMVDAVDWEERLEREAGLKEREFSKTFAHTKATSVREALGFFAIDQGSDVRFSKRETTHMANIIDELCRQVQAPPNTVFLIRIGYDTVRPYVKSVDPYSIQGFESYAQHKCTHIIIRGEYVVYVLS